MPHLQFDEQQITDMMDRVVERTFHMDFSWDWPGGVAFYGVCEAYEVTGNPAYLEKVKTWVDEYMDEGLPRWTVNAVSVGHVLLTLYTSTQEEKYIEIATQMADYLLHDAAKFGDGVLQHTVNSDKDIFPEQAWVDTMFMAGFYLLRIGDLLGKTDYFNEGLRQYHGHENLLQDAETHLYYHGWDNIAQNHMSSVFWARGNAWAALTMSKALKLIPVTHPSYMIIAGSLRDQLSALVRLQDSSGFWHTVLDRSDSPLETSGSAGIGVALLSRGTLYNKFSQKTLDALSANITANGSVTHVSAGTAVMDDAHGYMQVPDKRIQGWGQGLALAFFAQLLQSKNNKY
ncbi:glycoside hydrolase family 88 protein [Paenibacillus sp. ACRRY]|uniref:glycoside hydrolase family 88/105 protein n=1 Tax=Paenibacillus sp. ACRRY TaxID=2918208 RepID=UPI001EF60B25|nr:glycoside hydrolase family 88 protein [Paenibacillus sp. ACRRY]